MLAKAIQVAKRSTIKRHKTGAVIVDKSGKVLAVGWSHKTATVLATTPWSMHAEMHAIIRAYKKKADLKGATIYIATICGKSGNLTSAKPCNSCGGFIKEAGIKEVIYTERLVA